jgi:pimeloyl-ACP methyl ester carboxylesterase
MPKVRYLLISPLTGPISLLAAPGLGHKFWPRQPENQDVIGKHNTLILYGDQDIFSSARKITAWAAKLSAEPGYQVTHVEVAGAGHFWLENGVEEKLRTSLREWEARPWR